MAGNLPKPGRGELPWGVRLSAGFLEVFVVLIVMPTGLVGVVALSTVQAARHSPEDAGKALLGAGFVVGLFISLLGMTLGAGWLASYIRASHQEVARAYQRECRREPFRVVVQPVLMALVAYSFLAVLAWALVKMESGKSSVTWLFFWLVAGYGSFFLQQRLKKRAERRGDG